MKEEDAAATMSNEQLRTNYLSVKLRIFQNDGNVSGCCVLNCILCADLWSKSTKRILFSSEWSITWRMRAHNTKKLLISFHFGYLLFCHFRYSSVSSRRQNKLNLEKSWNPFLYAPLK